MQRLWILALVATGGAAALSWEVIWQLQASLALGVSAFGTAVTLAATMGGMSLGALAMGRWLRGRPVERPLRAYGALELVVGISGLLLLPGFELLERLDAWIYPLSPTLTPPLRVAGIALLLAPPTLAMGATIPVFALVARGHALSIAVLYGLNTAGAAIGVLALTFFVLPHLGVLRTCLLLAALNAGIFASLWRSFQPRASATLLSPPAHPVEPESGPSLPLALVLVFGTGFVTFGLEVAWFRALRAAFYATTETFAILLASVLVPLALGARLVPWLRRRGVTPGHALAVSGAAILLATPVIERMDIVATQLQGASYAGMIARWLAVVLATVGPAMASLGVVLPWCLEAHLRPGPAARLYAANTAGSVAGSLLAAWVLLPAVGFAQTAWLLGLLVVILALLASGSRFRIAAGAAGAAALAVAMAGSSSVGRERIVTRGPHTEDWEIIAYREAPDSTVSVVEDHHDRRLLVIDGFVATTERGGAAYMEWMGRLPMLLHPAPKRALVIAFGTGQTAHGVRDEGPERLDVVDVSEAVFDMARYFPSNRGVLGDPRVRAIVMDGRAWVRRQDTRYDVVTLEPMAPHFAGTNALYSVEFYELLATRLAPGGVVAQWLPVHLLPPFYAASVAATFQAVFPDAGLWVDPRSGTGILLGRRHARGTPLGEAWPGFGRGSGERSMTEAEIRRALRLDAEGLARFAATGGLITDDNQLLAYSPIRAYLARFGSAQLREVNARRIALARAGAVPPPPLKRVR